MDSGAVRHVIHADALPDGIDVLPNATGKHFPGARGETIERFGECRILLTTVAGGEISCEWNLAEVDRPLHAVSQIAGLCDAPTRKHDVFFNNKKCVVMWPGIVEHVQK